MTNIKEILELWFKIHGTQKEFLPIHQIGNCVPWSYAVKKDLEEAFELDPEGLTALLILDNFRDDFFSNCALTISDILQHEHFPAFIEDCRHLTAMLSEEEIVSALTDFVSNVSHAIEQIGIERDDVAKMLSNRYEMAILRRDSLRSMETLTLHQFFQGDTKTDHLAFLPDIHLFWNMNSLVRCAWQSDDGVSINLVKDPLATSSYFAFVAKNGGNLTVLTDKPREAHPLSKYMSRRPEKDFTKRVFRNHFPYGLMDLTYDHKGYLHPGRSSIVPLQEKPIKVGSVATMEPDEIIWTIMMFSLLDAKLYKENYHCAELSYTSDMIENPDVAAALIQSNETTGLMVKEYKPLVAPVLTVKDTEEDPQYKRYPGTGIHNWMYERYKETLPEEILNGLLPSDESTLFLLPDNTVFLAPKERTKEPWHHGDDPMLLQDPAERDGYTDENGVRIFFGRGIIENTEVLKKMTGDEFGTKESLMQDYRWYARYNAAKFIRHQAEEEFKRRKAEVTEWVYGRIQQNLERISRDVIYYSLSKDKTEHPCDFYMFRMEREPWKHTTGCYKFAKDRKAHLRGPSLNPSAWAFHNVADTGCWFSEDAPCSHILKVNAFFVEDLLYLTGCASVEELPDVLRNWKCASRVDMSDYTGNHILDRVDPMDWVVKNPWEALRFNIAIGIGKKYLSKVKKELALDQSDERKD